MSEDATPYDTAATPRLIAALRELRAESLILASFAESEAEAPTVAFWMDAADKAAAIIDHLREHEDAQVFHSASFWWLRYSRLVSAEKEMADFLANIDPNDTLNVLECIAYNGKPASGARSSNPAAGGIS